MENDEEEEKERVYKPKITKPDESNDYCDYESAEEEVLGNFVEITAGKVRSYLDKILGEKSNKISIVNVGPKFDHKTKKSDYGLINGVQYIEDIGSLNLKNADNGPIIIFEADRYNKENIEALGHAEVYFIQDKKAYSPLNSTIAYEEEDEETILVNNINDCGWQADESSCLAFCMSLAVLLADVENIENEIEITKNGNCRTKIDSKITDFLFKHAQQSKFLKNWPELLASKEYIENEYFKIGGEIVINRTNKDKPLKSNHYSIKEIRNKLYPKIEDIMKK